MHTPRWVRLRRRSNDGAAPLAGGDPQAVARTLLENNGLSSIRVKAQIIWNKHEKLIECHKYPELKQLWNKVHELQIFISSHFQGVAIENKELAAVTIKVISTLGNIDKLYSHTRLRAGFLPSSAAQRVRRVDQANSYSAELVAYLEYFSRVISKDPTFPDSNNCGSIIIPSALNIQASPWTARSARSNTIGFAIQMSKVVKEISGAVPIAGGILQAVFGTVALVLDRNKKQHDQQEILEEMVLRSKALLNNLPNSITHAEWEKLELLSGEIEALLDQLKTTSLYRSFISPDHHDYGIEQLKERLRFFQAFESLQNQQRSSFGNRSSPPHTCTATTAFNSSVVCLNFVVALFD